MRGLVLCKGACAFVFLVVGLVLIGTAVFLGTYGMGTLVPELERQTVNQMATLLPGHLTYSQWTEPTVPLYKDIYFFNLTNPDEFANGAIPIVQEVGPYRYRETRVKTPNAPRGYNHTEGNTLMPYTQRKYFNFDNESTPHYLSEDDVITTLNFPLVGATALAETQGKLIKEALRALLDFQLKSKIYLKGKVKDLIWNYTDQLLKELHELQPDLLPSQYYHIQLNDSAADQKESVAHTGTDNISLLCQYAQWNGMEKLSIWFGEDANELNGTEGLFFHPWIKRGEPLQAFVDDVFRSFHLNYSEEVEHLGIKAYRYKLDEREFWSAHHYRRNAIYGSWCPDGLLYMGVTQTPVTPVFASKPHFLDGDPSLLRDVKGLHPNRSKHDIVTDVEPTTGANIFVKRQLQINMQTNRSDYWNQLKHINATNDTLYYPIMYINENGQINEPTKQILEQQVFQKLAVVQYAGWSVVGVLGAAGVLCLVISLSCCLCLLPHCRRRGKHSAYSVIEQAPATKRSVAEKGTSSSKPIQVNDVPPLLS